jgi:hypothetical protein
MRSRGARYGVPWRRVEGGGGRHSYPIQNRTAASPSVSSPSAHRPRCCIYTPSPWPYPGHFEVRRVSRNGGIRWKRGWVNISHALLEENVGLEEVADGIWSLYFGPLLLGRFHEDELKLHGARIN